MASLQAALDRLRVPHAAVQAAAIAAAFSALRSSPGLSPAAREAAIRQCLGLEDAAAVEASVKALVALTRPGSGGTDGGPLLHRQEAADLLLTSLSVASASTVPVLADGLLRLHIAGAEEGAAPASVAAAWRSHPLARALLAHPAAAQPLVLGMARALYRAAAGREGLPSFAALLALLRPFVSWVLMDPGLQAAQPLVAPSLHSALARVACGCGGDSSSGDEGPSPQQQLLALLAAHLPAWPLATPAQREAAAAAVADVADVVESCQEEPDADTAAALLHGLASLCCDAVSQQAMPLLQQAAAALARLVTWWPEAAAPLAAPLVLLLAEPGLAAGEARALLPLAARLLSAGSGGAAPLAAAAEAPLVQLLAFLTSDSNVHKWASHCMQRLARPRAGGDGSTCAAAEADLPGASSSDLLGRLWHDPQAARHWLASLRLALSTSAGTGGGGKLAGGREQRQLATPTLLLLCALLQHPAATVASAAVDAAAAAASAAPLLGLTLLPLLVLQLQRLTESFLSGTQRAAQPSPLLLRTLRALPLLARHPAVLPFVLRAMQPLLAPSAPALLQAAGLRLLCALWVSTGRGFQQLRTAVIGYAPPGPKPALELRLARAACLRDICQEDGGRAVELVGLIQECLGDEAPEVQAAALDCVAELCEQDVLEFYAAWRVVHTTAPTLPAHPLAAAAWVRLLGGGALDAGVHPEIAMGVVDALWAAAAHASSLVRRQAYASLAAFEPSTLEELGALRPLSSYVSLLRQELAHSAAGEGSTRSQRQRRRLEAARQECEALVATALAHEHATRRRPHAVAAAPPARGHAAPAPASAESGGRRAVVTAAAAMNHRLTSALPKLLLGGAAPTTAALLPRLPELPAPATAALLFWSPPPPSAKSPAVLASAAREAAADYQSLAVELIRQPQTAAQLSAASCSTPGGPAAAAGSWVQGWRRFLRRWAAAVRASSSAGSGDQGSSAAGEAAVASQQRFAALQLWSAIAPHLTSRPVTPAAAENAAWAAAALSSAGPQPVPDVVSAAHAALSALLDDGQQATAVRQAAASALGAMAEPVRTALGQPALQVLLTQLQALVQQGPVAGGAPLRGAAAVGLGLACRQLAAAAADAPPVRATVQAAVAALVAAQQQQAGSDAAAAEVCSGLAAALRAAVALEVGAAQQLPLLLSSSLAQLSTLQAPAAATVAALAPLLQAAAAAGFQQGSLAAEQVGATLAALLAAAGSSDGRARGAAATAAAALLAAAMEEGYTPLSGEHVPGALLATLLGLADDASKLPHAAAAKCGAAAGIAALLEGQALDLGSQEFKGAVNALEQLALRGTEPRTRRGCAWALAHLCLARKLRGSAAAAAGAHGSEGGAAGGTAAAAAKGLQQLAPDGALRPLVESLLEGRWALPGQGPARPAAGADAPLTAAEAASALRCLAAAPRLPPLSYSALCRKLLRAHSGGDLRGAAAGLGVWQACIALAAAHGARSPAYQLADFIASDLLPPARLDAMPGAARAAALASLAPLLAALPEAQAAAALEAACGACCPDLASGGTMGGGCQLATALLDGLHAVLRDPGSDAAASTVGPAVRQAAQRCLDSVVLPRLPPPAVLPVCLASLAEVSQSGARGELEGLERWLAPEQRCWAAALRCLAALPQALALQLVLPPSAQRQQQRPLQLASAAALLVAAGAADARALQAARNLALEAQPAAAVAAVSDDAAEAAALLVGRAAASLPLSQQQQWLGDVLDASLRCNCPAGAFRMAACITAACAAGALLSGERAAPQLAAGHAWLASTEAAVAALPEALGALLEAASWRQQRAAVLHRMTAALQQLGGGGQHPWAAPLLRRCLLAARHVMPEQQWAALAGVI